MPAGRPRAGGFTLIELMIVVAIISILASIAIPKFANMLFKAQEGSLKGNLGSLRSALTIYYADTNGITASCTAGAGSSLFNNVLVPRYIAAVPVVKNGLHPPTSSVYCDYQMVGGSIHDGQGWYYDGANPLDNYSGGVWVACDHTDTSSNDWTSY